VVVVPHEDERVEDNFARILVLSESGEDTLFELFVLDEEELRVLGSSGDESNPLGVFLS
jgi:hypothetical protein